MQKSDFLKALGEMWTGFDARVLRYKVLFSTEAVGSFVCGYCHFGIEFLLMSDY